MTDSGSNLSAYLVRATWEDQRTPGTAMRMLYGCLASSSDEAVEDVKGIRSSFDKVELTEDKLSEQTARALKLVRGKPCPL